MTCPGHRAGWTNLGNQSWVCAECRRPSRATLEGGAMYNEFSGGPMDSQRHTTKQLMSTVALNLPVETYQWTPRMSATNTRIWTFGGTMTASTERHLSIHEQMWAAADAAYDALVAHQQANGAAVSEEFHRLRGQLRGMSEIIALWAPRQYASGDDVAREIMHRGQMRAAGKTDYTSPGYEREDVATLPMPPETVQEISPGAVMEAPSAETVSAPPPVNPEAVLDVATIKEAWATGKFSVATLAGAFSTTEAKITEIVG